ncbi:hypothetical protein GGTG_09657 [Gaeumannomyces tritici R3-111a-1]|uniref:Uncharacterized protein n=1 Tax=Gaeumannomyces tritici (strain R3-111a-1) TaxID=644352 RepID=J3P819_GAET3|nr:hypothetical protein GGTG_09657 [Gaeumannomyces tritici R3-111a-1]EJT72802.1 hypothetical protein GGTG_09657 [Gaeumannomyces tritici R3-111a-1]
MRGSSRIKSDDPQRRERVIRLGKLPDATSIHPWGQHGRNEPPVMISGSSDRPPTKRSSADRQGIGMPPPSALS